MVLSIPSPPSNGIDLGPLEIRFYGLFYVIAVIAAVAITTRRWERQGGSRELVHEVVLWAVPRRTRRRAPVLRHHQLGRGAPGMVGPAGGVARRPGRVGRHRDGHAGRRAGTAPPRRGCRALHGRGRAGAPGGAGDRAARQLLQPGAVRPPDHPAVGDRDRPGAPARPVRRVRDVSPDVPLRTDLESHASRASWSGSAAAERSVPPDCSRSTSRATPAFASSRNCCAPTRLTTCSDCG